MTPIGYMSGPGAHVAGSRSDQRKFKNLTSNQYRQQALVPLQDATHGGEDVALYAIGPFSHLFHRTIDNTFIAHAMKYALCLPPYHQEKPRCRPFANIFSEGFNLLQSSSISNVLTPYAMCITGFAIVLV